MATETAVIETLLQYDAFHNEDSKVQGIAKLARDKGFSSLTHWQKKVLEPFMSRPCDGVVDPGAHHNNCSTVLAGKELVNAYQGDFEYGGMMCIDCQSEKHEYRQAWDRISKE